MTILQKEVEIILARHLTSSLAIPAFIVDPQGDLLFYNEPAEAILGKRFEETGAMPMSEWSTIFAPVTEDGAPLPPEGLPLAVALTEQRPAHRAFWIHGLDGVMRRLGTTAFPLIGQSNRFLGAVAFFWEESV